mgnify:CR=1 FL=1
MNAITKLKTKARSKVYLMEYSNQSGNLEELVFETKKEAVDHYNNTFVEKVENYKELKNEGIYIESMLKDELDVRNGKKKYFRRGRKIICYIQESLKGFNVYTGKPSDPSCISWNYNTYWEAEETAQMYFNNYTKAI